MARRPCDDAFQGPPVAAVRGSPADARATAGAVPAASRPLGRFATPAMTGNGRAVMLRRDMDLITPTDRGLYCGAGDFHIDPWRPVARAIITHAHSDHARYGSEVYVCHRDTAPILRKRLGDVTIETATYGQVLTRNGVELSL